jgi:hypothetical protein
MNPALEYLQNFRAKDLEEAPTFVYLNKLYRNVCCSPTLNKFSVEIVSRIDIKLSVNDHMFLESLAEAHRSMLEEYLVGCIRTVGQKAGEALFLEALSDMTLEIK